jgi:hypothetical protein
MPTVDRVLRPFEWLLDALTDPEHANRTALALLIGFTALYTVYAVVSNGSTDVHFDVGELVSWSREPAWGYRHPPMSAWVVAAWFSVFPLADWSAYLLAMVTSAAAIGIAWHLYGDWLDGNRRALALAMLMLIPLYTFHAIKFNPNTVMMPFWAAATLYFLRTLTRGSTTSAALTGLFGAGAVLGKYWSVNLVAGIGLAALLHRRRAALLRSPAPYVAIAVLVAVLLPHLIWLAAHGAVATGFVRSIAVDNAARGRSLSYMAGILAYVAAPVLLFASLRPGRLALVDTLRPTEPDRRLLALVLWLPLVLPPLLNLVVPTRLTAVWTIPNWTLLPVVLLSSRHLVVTRRVGTVALALALGIPVLATIAAPGIASAAHRRARLPNSHFRLLGEAAQQSWAAATTSPLRLIGGDDRMALGAVFYAADRPVALRGFPLDEVSSRRITQDGIVVLCGARDPACMAYQDDVAAHWTAQRVEVELVRHFRGVAGPSQRYVLLLVPPG